ncbi:MAG: Tm-1-like ATP-binding domain-containing protein, partial [Anaerolineae bacterium]|nr:Tm-1-like ATP-binding domain-containing protein [Anaerolineae bacterium]
KPLIAASMFGNTTPAVDRAKETMEEHGYEVLVFHATGTGGRTMEALIEDGYIDGVLDITTTEWADEVCGGVLSAGPTRLEAAAKTGTPQVVVPGCIDMANFWAIETVPEKYQDRNLYKWNPNVTLMRTNVDENAEMGLMFAERLNQATGPVAVFVPLKGVSMLDSAGEPFWNPEADQAFLETLKQNLREGIPVYELEYNINDPEFVDAVSSQLLEFLGRA